MCLIFVYETIQMDDNFTYVLGSFLGVTDKEKEIM